MSAVLPIGGPTGLNHESSAQIDQAVTWLEDNFSSLRAPIIGELRARFSLTVSEAMQALSEYKSQK